MLPEDIISVFNKNHIKNFNYIIHLDNLKSIFQYEIVCRNLLTQYDLIYHDISKKKYQKNRSKNFLKFFPNEDIHDYVPLYISTHTPMIKKLSSPYIKYYAVLKITNKIFRDLKDERKKNIKISNQNINQTRLNDLQIKNISDFKNTNEFEEFLKWDLIANRNICNNYPDKLYKAAEVLVPGKINQRFITKICPKTKDIRSVKNHIKRVLDYKWYEKKEYLLDFNNNEFKV
ncbi:MAG: DUF4433 domain-containing protein [Candidatus Lokiarchaeota archaeon]|nr:DUF4433 domain-containing protein [Candidatus Lokiarchaeota archaeon]